MEIPLSPPKMILRIMRLWDDGTVHPIAYGFQKESADQLRTWLRFMFPIDGRYWIEDEDHPAAIRKIL